MKSTQIGNPPEVILGCYARVAVSPNLGMRNKTLIWR